MNVENYLDQINELLEEGKATLVGGKTKVDAELIRQAVDEIRLQMPEEIAQARKIIADRKDILVKAQSAGEDIIRDAERQAARLVDAHEVTKSARDTAAEIIAAAKQQGLEMVDKAKANAEEISENANQWAKDMRNSASEFVDTIMRESDEILSESLEDFSKSLDNVRRARAQLKNATQKMANNN